MEDNELRADEIKYQLKYSEGDRDYRIIGVDHFAPEGEIYILTKADCLEDCGDYWTDEEIRRENGED